MTSIWEQLDSLEEDWLCEMSTIRGKYIKVEDLDFSFYFSARNPRHAIRVKIRWDRDKLGNTFDGILELHGDYKYVPSPGSKRVPQYDIDTAKYFFKRYKALFAAVWEMKLDENLVIDYLKGQLSLQELVSQFENLPQASIEKMSKCSTVTELNNCVRENKIFNMND